MPQHSAGILVYRRTPAGIELFLAHPGGPFWARKDDAAWSIPKGLYDENEEPLAAARREFEEETGTPIDGRFLDLGQFKQPGSKIIRAFAVEADVDETRVKSNLFEMEWPPKSGRRQLFPEIDRAAWFALEAAARKMSKGQLPILRELARQLAIVLPAQSG